MNKLLTKIVGLSLGLSMAIGVGVAASYSGKDAVRVDAAPVSGSGTGVLNFSSSHKVTNSGDTIEDDQSATYTFTTDSEYIALDGGSIHTGSGSKTCSHQTWTTSDYSNVLITSVIINAKMASGSGVSISATIDGDDIESPKSISADATNYTFTNSNNYSGGDLIIKAYRSSATKKAIYVYSITVNYQSSSTDPSITVDKSMNVKQGQSANIDVAYANVASGVVISAISDDTTIATITSSVTTTGTSGTASFTVNGITDGVANISFSATYSSKQLSASCEVTVYEEKSLEKISKVSELNTSREDGGRYVIAYAGDNTVVMSTVQNSNNRGKTTATIVDDSMIISGTNTIALVNILKEGDYYTIYDPVNDGYLYAYSGQNYLRTSNPSTKTDYYYWSISFSGANAVITNKGNSYVIRYNSNSSIFSTYNGTQNAISLYEVDEDIPAYVKLTSLTATDNSVEEGSVLSYIATYLPANATEGITVTGSDDTVATVNSSAMNNGTLTIEIEGVSSGSITLNMVGDDPDTAVNVNVTITVTSYVATHTLVTSSSSLANGSKVIIACTDADYNYSAEKSTGTNNLNGVITGFASDKSSLSAAETSQEFVVWCVDSTNGYYVFSDGGYYLQAPDTANNYLQRTEILSENCIFTITDSTDGVTVTSNLHNTYNIQFNSGISKFSLYSSTQKSSSLYLSNGTLNTVQGFVDAFMHFGNVPHNPDDSDTGNCKADGKGYFDAALAAYNQLTPEQQEDFCTEATYANAYERLSDWASANGYSFNGYTLEQDARLGLSIFGVDNQTSITVIVIIAAISVTSIGALLVLKKRKEQF